MLVFCERGDITPPPTPGFQLKVQALGVIPPIENVLVAKKLPPWHIVVFDGAVVKLGQGITVTVVNAEHVLLGETDVAEVAPRTVKVVEVVKLFSTKNELFDVNPFGPNQVNEVTALLVFKLKVLDWPEQIRPELVGVTRQIMPQLV